MSTIASDLKHDSEVAPQPRSLAYPQIDSARDLRIDFLRGLIMLIVITVHMEYFSIFSFFVWERFGVISSAEGFVALSGMVLGMVYGRKIKDAGFRVCAGKMFDRAVQLYRINLFMIVSIAAINLIPVIDAFAVMNFVSPGSGKVYPLYPPPEAGFKAFLKQALLLRAGPHQFQVIGLYVILLMLAPLVLWLASSGRTKFLLGFSWVLYGIGWSTGWRVTGAQFEYAFPLLLWQLLFVHAMVFGVHKQEILALFTGNKAKLLVLGAAICALGFFIFTLNNPNPRLPDAVKLHLIPRDVFYYYYGLYFEKSGLGIGRVFNNLCLFIIFYAALTRLWVPLNKAFGWLCVPLGQASLYVFVVHVFFVLLFSLTPMHTMDNFLTNSAMHLTTIGCIWLLVKNKVMFGIIPR